MRAPDAPAEPPRFIVLWLAWKDLRHEWILTGCLMLALAAILTPLLIVLGLKEGFISHLRNDLVQDPIYREVRPAETVGLEDQWFRDTGAARDVAFVVPGILRGASIVMARSAAKAESFDLLPTAAGDPLLVENGGTVPEAGEVTLSHPAAELLKVQAGDKLTVVVSRTRGGRNERAEQAVTVASVLSERADSLPRLYGHLDLVVDVEAYKEGRSVPHRNWPGGTASPHLSFDGLFLVAPEQLSSTLGPRLTQGTGLTILEEATPAAFTAAVGIAAPEGARLYLMRKQTGAATINNIRAVRNRTRGAVEAFLPVVNGLTVALARPGAGLAPDGAWSDPIPVAAYSLAPKAAERVGLAPPPWGAVDKDAEFAEIDRIALPAGHPLADAGTVLARLAITEGTGEVIVPLRVAGQAPGSVAQVPAELAAMLATSRERAVAYDPAVGSLVLSERGFRGFRLYAASIDDAPALVERLKQQGINVVARIDEILRMQSLDRGLTGLFLLIAMVGATGGVAALLASLYAAVERKRSELGMMRLLGLSPRRVFTFPVYQGTIISAGGLAISFAAYGVIGVVLNNSFRDELGGDPAVYLPGAYAGLIVGITLVASVLSSLAAAARTTRIEPAEAIRAE